jgi:hypothetical protein
MSIAQFPARVQHESVEIRGAVYLVERLAPTDPDVFEAVRLHKADGTAYDLSVGSNGCTCDCASFTYVRGPERLCKHLSSLLSLGVLASRVALDDEGRVIGVDRHLGDAEPEAADLLVNESRLLADATAEVERLAGALASALAERDTLARLAADLAGQLGAAERRVETLEGLGPDDFMPRITREEFAGRSLPHAARGIDAETKEELSRYYDAIRGRDFDDEDEDERGSGRCFSDFDEEAMADRYAEGGF